MRIKMLTSKEKVLPGGGRITFVAGEYYLAAPGTALTEDEAIEWIMSGEAEDEEGKIKRPEPPAEEAVPADELASSEPAAVERTW